LFATAISTERVPGAQKEPRKTVTNWKDLVEDGLDDYYAILGWKEESWENDVPPAAD